MTTDFRADKEFQPLYTIKEVAVILEIAPRTIMRHIKDGSMHFVKIGGKWKISKENLTAYVNGQPQK